MVEQLVLFSRSSSFCTEISRNNKKKFLGRIFWRWTSHQQKSSQRRRRRRHVIIMDFNTFLKNIEELGLHLYRALLCCFVLFTSFLLLLSIGTPGRKKRKNGTTWGINVEKGGPLYIYRVESKQKRVCACVPAHQQHVNQSDSWCVLCVGLAPAIGLLCERSLSQLCLNLLFLSFFGRCWFYFRLHHTTNKTWREKRENDGTLMIRR